MHYDVYSEWVFKNRFLSVIDEHDMQNYKDHIAEVHVFQMNVIMSIFMLEF
jgi:hypothetical protein